MYTRCPECKKAIEITTEQLRESRGMLQCDACRTKFDALEFLSDHAEEAISQSSTEDAFFDLEQPSKKSTGFWLIGIIFGILLLAGQIVYFEGNRLVQNRLLRPWLKKSCQLIGCQLPPYRNLEEIHILKTTLNTTSPDKVVFDIVLTNQADFPQPYPKLKLTLIDYQGKTFAQRVFSTDNYRPPSTMLKPDQTVEIQLEIVNPDNPVGGYRFSLL